MTHMLSCFLALACWQFLDQLVTTFLEPVQVKERSWVSREGAGSLPEPEAQPRPMMWSGCRAPSLASPASPGQTGQGTHLAVPTGAWKSSRVPCRVGLAGLAAPSAPWVCSVRWKQPEREDSVCWKDSCKPALGFVTSRGTLLQHGWPLSPFIGLQKTLFLCSSGNPTLQILTPK